MYRQAVSNFQIRRKNPALDPSRSSPLTDGDKQGPVNASCQKLKRVVWQIQGHSQCLPFTAGDKGRHKSHLEN